MSDVGVISYEYQRNSELAVKINEAIIIIKKVRYRLSSSEALSEEQKSQSQQFIIDIIGKISRAFPSKSKQSAIETSSEIELPASLIQRIRTKHKPQVVYYLDDLKKLSERLKQGIDLLTDNDINLLDEMCAAIDSQTATIFQKFWKE